MLKSSLNYSFILVFICLVFTSTFFPAFAQSTRYNAPKPGEDSIQVSGGKIWYYVVGNSNKPPLLMLHGGPGGTSYSMFAFSPLADEFTLIILDQIGTGRSEYISDTTLMTIEYFVDQLHEFVQKIGLDTYYLYGHSWGTMLGLDFYLKYPEGIRAMIMNSPLVSSERWMFDADTLLASLPDSIQTAIKFHEKNKTYDSDEYQDAIYVHYKNFISRHPSIKNTIEVKRAPGNELMYNYMWGPSEFNATGTLKNYDRLNRLKDIAVPTLWVTGEFDEARPATVKYYHSLTPNSQFEVIPDAAHGTMWDNQEENVRVIREWLRETKGVRR